MSEVYTNWTKATINPHEALIGLLSCLNAGKNAWIEVRKNDEQNMDYPIKKKNPELDNPFNWTMAYGTPKNSETLESHRYFNETERDLTYNWVACFGEKQAIEEYQKNKTIKKGLIASCGICHPVRIKDANYYRTEICGDNCRYNYWTTWWRPNDGIPYYIIDKDVEEAFIICYNDDPVDRKDAIEKASQFLADYAATLS